MILTLAQLVRAQIAPTQARAFELPLAAACPQFGITTRLRLAAFLAECGHESGGFTRLEENLHYLHASALVAAFGSRFRNADDAEPYIDQPEKLANLVYGYRADLGNDQAGDGWKYRGRGLIGLTGKANYNAAAGKCGRPYVTAPELVGLATDACLTAACFWHTHGCNELADAGAFVDITRKINPHLMGQAQREQRYQWALAAIPSTPGA